MRTLLILLASFLATTTFAQQYDLVLQGGRVMDPESGLDATRNVGISKGKIARISADPLTGQRVLDARGLIVAPGFIDLHQHAQDTDSGRLKAFDGVTTALEMEIGATDIERFLAEKQGRSLINYGATASHCAARAIAFDVPMGAQDLVPRAGRATDEPASDAQIEQMLKRLRSQLDAGALGVGMGIQYTPGATRLEVIRMFRLAADRHVPVFTHVRSAGRVEPGSSIEAVSEVIAAATVTGASLQIVHVNSSCLKDGLECVALIAGARARGIDVTTEAYPYEAGMTGINSALFNPGWQQKFGIDYSAIQLPDTGERLNQARFEAMHASEKPMEVLIFINSQEMVDKVIAEPLVMIASDGESGHPRNAGTYSKILARYVREQGRLTLMDAIRKMSLMPAQRLEKATPAGRLKGRLQEGADADVIAFDPKTVHDRSTYAQPSETSVGMKYVVVEGTLLINNGVLVANLFPGRPLKGGGP